MKISNPLKVKYLSIGQEWKGSKHPAIDCGLPTARAGTPCLAVEDGLAGSEGDQVLKDYGFTLRGNSGALYYYGHCRRNVSNKQKVRRGDVIGVVDTLERQNKARKKYGVGPMKGSHCHFEVHPTGKWSVRDNPMCYFDRKEVKYKWLIPGWPTDYSIFADKHLPEKEDDMYKKKYDDLKEKYEKCRKTSKGRSEDKKDLSRELKALKKDFIAKVQTEAARVTESLNEKLDNYRSFLKDLKDKLFPKKDKVKQSEIKTEVYELKNFHDDVNQVKKHPLILFLVKLKSWKRKRSRKP